MAAGKAPGNQKKLKMETKIPVMIGILIKKGKIMGKSKITKTTLYYDLEKRYNELLHILKEIDEEQLQKSSEKIIIHRKKKGFQLGVVNRENGIRTEKYLKKSEVNIIRKLIQKDYDTEIKAYIIKEINAIKMLMKNHIDDFEIEKLYYDYPLGLREYVDPIIISDEKIIADFEALKYEKKGFHKNDPVFYTEKGECVRSKSEVAIANELFRQSIPYKYELPLQLSNGIVFHPDFTILNVKKREQIYWEHFGMMGDAEYMQSAYRKIEEYKKNDIFPGVDIIFTEETLHRPLNSIMIKKTIKKYLG